MKKTDTYFKSFRKFEKLSLPHKALLASTMGWSLALSASIIYCVYYTRYVNSEHRGLLASIVWFFQEYGIWFILTPALLLGLSYFGNQRRMGWFGLLVVFALFISISFRLMLDFYLNPSANFVTSLVYFTPDHLFIVLIVVLGWALVFRKVENSSVFNLQIPEEDLRESDRQLDTLDAYKGNRKVSVSISAIQIVSAAGNYVELHCVDNQYLMRSTMKELEEQLKSYNFIRIHRSHLVNPTAIVSIQGDSLILNSGTKLTVSQRYRKNLNSFQ
jgi:two-component system, LytTR family, response regulator